MRHGKPHKAEFNEITYRPVHRCDYHDMREIASSAWDLSDYTSNRLLHAMLLQHYIYTYLAEQNFTLVARKDDGVAGFIMGRCQNTFRKRNVLRYLIPRFFLQAIFHLLPVGREYLANFAVINAADKKLMGNRRFDGELVLFAVRSDCRKQGIGRHLLKAFWQFASDHNARNMYLFTDAYSDVGYYRSRGYQQLGQVNIRFPSDLTPATFFLFGFEIPS